MRFAFTKMQALGNDFMVIDAINQDIRLNSSVIRRLADRRFGIGYDQCLVIAPSNTPEIDFFYRIFNADGSEVGQCGNGVRCIARYIFTHELSVKKQLHIASNTTRFETLLNADHSVTVNMGVPQVNKVNIDSIKIEDEIWPLQILDLGNPHAVITIEDVEQSPVIELGKRFNQHTRFKHGVNVGFMQYLSADKIKLRVYERGSGETLACGSGACAAVIAGCLQQQLNPEVSVSLPGGLLDIYWEGINTPVYMTGPAEFVFDGTVDL